MTERAGGSSSAPALSAASSGTATLCNSASRSSPRPRGAGDRGGAGHAGGHRHPAAHARRDSHALRRGDAARQTSIPWLSDNGSIYTALDTVITAERLRLVSITAPAASPQSNGMSEAFVNTLRRDYITGADLSSAAALLEQVPAWIADYNAVAAHSALGYQSPSQYRQSRDTLVTNAETEAMS